MSSRGFRQQGGKVVWPGFNYGPATRHIPKVGRNDPCPCGSENKYKDCHESHGEEWLTKLAYEKARTAAREEMKAKGVPWWKRWLAGA